MRIVISGAGHVGYNVAAYLSRDANDITLVDPNPNLIEHASRELDVNGIVGHYSSPEVLAKAGIAEADILIAVSPYDERNMVACQIAHSLFDTPKKIARISNQDYLDPAWNNLFSRDHMPIDMVISPEIEVANSVYERLSITGTTEAIPVCNNTLHFLGVVCKESCPIVHTPLRQLRTLFSNFFVNIVSILRHGKPILLNGDSQIMENDEVFFIVESQSISTIMSYLGIDSTDTKNIIILGGGNVGLALSQRLSRSIADVRVTLIESAPERAEYLAQSLEKELVIHGDALQPSILKEAEIENADTLVAVTDKDETNALCSLQAKYMGCKRAIALIKRPNYTSLLLATNIDAVISPHDIIVSRITHHVRRGRVKAVHRLRWGTSELIEAITSETCKIINKPIKDLKLPEGVRIASIQRGNSFIFPAPDTVIKSGDFVTIFSPSEFAYKVDGFFSAGIELF